MAIAFLLCSIAVHAKDVPPRPSPPRLVNDYAGVLSATEREALERKLVAFDDSTSNQIVIVLEKTLDGDEAASYAQRIGETWGVGQQKERNGVVIYAAIDDRKMAIQVGYGLEPVITDAATYHVRTEQMVPYFRQQQYYEGLDKATDVLMKIASGEFKSSQYSKKRNEQPKISTGTIIFIIVIVIILINIFRKMGGGGRRRRRGWDAFTGGAGPFIGGGFGGFGGRGGFGGGGGGGGFGGFGGGSFGGGGSSGSW
ncbi:MAG: TPM domain-containing protein [Bacteroidia bacterium]